LAAAAAPALAARPWTVLLRAAAFAADVIARVALTAPFKRVAAAERTRAPARGRSGAAGCPRSGTAAMMCRARL
jgi:hypothetical protein